MGEGNSLTAEKPHRVALRHLKNLALLDEPCLVSGVEEPEARIKSILRDAGILEK